MIIFLPAPLRGGQRCTSRTALQGRERTRPRRLSVGGQTHVAPCRGCSSPSPVEGKTARMISCIKVGTLGCSQLMPGAGTRWCLMSGGIGLWCGEVRASSGICNPRLWGHVLHCAGMSFVTRSMAQAMGSDASERGEHRADGTMLWSCPAWRTALLGP